MFGEKKNKCVQGCVIVSELDDPSGHHDFPWMALHCNFQGLVAESDSDRDPGNGCFLRAPRRVCAALLASDCYLKARAKFTWAAASAGIKQWTEHLAGTACGRANDRRWLRWRHVATRLEFCLRRLSPPFPAGLWTACQQHAIRNPGSSGPAEAPGHSDSATANSVRDLQAVHMYTPTLSVYDQPRNS